jgi:pilus assembly protein FimV
VLTCQANALMLWYFLSFQDTGQDARSRPAAVDRQTGVHKLIAKSHQRQLTTLAIATLLALGAGPSAALSLGRITVQSALGEPLKAEIDLLDINAEEAASLQVRVAQPDAFKAAGLDYNPALSNLQARLQRRPDGRAYLRVSSERVINEPFVDMILETSWSSGRIVRDYTMLFDPPSLRQAASPSPTTTQLPAPAAASSVQAPAPRVPAAPAKAQPVARVPVPAPVAPAQPATAVAKPAPQSNEPTDQAIKVKPGDTAGKIAAANLLANVSLDQMLVALLRTNPDAFINDNINRIKAGAIVTLPSDEQAAATPAAEATQIIVAQSQDFNDFRRKLASNVPSTQVAPSSRVLSGKVQATVEEKKPVATTPDKLTLSKGAVQGKSQEDLVAQAHNQKETAARTAELSKNITDLSKLAVAASAPTPKVSSPIAPVAVVAPPATPASVVAPPVSVPKAAPSAPAKAASVAPKAMVPVPLPVPEPSFVDNLFENPLLPAGAAGLLALLAALGVYKARQRKQASQLDSDFTGRSLADSFAGSSGGQNVDTRDSLTTGSSMVYSPSQLDAVDDVDPVAEADVYLAYGRDLQAEEILKDALRTDPQRMAIHHKLLEIYAKRPDAKSYESIATLAFNLTDGSGSDWEKVCEKGLAIDPDNALYLPGGQPLTEPAVAPGEAASRQAVRDTTPDYASETTQAFSAPVTMSADLDLDLDFSAEEHTPQSAATAEPAPELEPDLALPKLTLSEDGAPDLALPDHNHADLNLDATQALDVLEASRPVETIETMRPTEPAGLDEVDELDHPVPTEPEILPGSMFGSLDFSVPQPEPEPEPEPTLQTQVPSPEPAAAAATDDMMNFDLGSLSLDLGEEPVTEPGAFIDETIDPLETKLALADEFRAIGDDDGARALIEEVLSEATGDLKAKAQSALNKL